MLPGKLANARRIRRFQTYIVGRPAGVSKHAGPQKGNPALKGKDPEVEKRVMTRCGPRDQGLITAWKESQEIVSDKARYHRSMMTAADVDGCT